MSIGLRYVFDHVARWPARLQGVLVKRRPIFRLGGQVSHGLSSRWLEWGHDLVMGGGTAAPFVCVCVCVCVETSEQLLWGDIRGPSYAAFLHRSRCRFTPPSPAAVESSGLICLSMKEMDCYYEPPEITREEHRTHQGGRLWAACVAFTPLYLTPLTFHKRLFAETDLLESCDICH